MPGRGASGDKSPAAARYKQGDGNIGPGAGLHTCVCVCVCVCVYLYADNYVVIRYLCVSMYVIIRVELHT